MNLRRIIYTVIGLAIVVQSVLLKDWLPAIIGGYFAAMGIFGFGCAGGGCGIPSTHYQKKTGDEIEFKEVK